ncbi:hypothetical protein TNIN_315791 [Trichonephila inaurata madagascariensis]|uniref:Uncharacterized protein n=1 Tax=Trichonephila inaurata madagascariensis TaxID=2747483 RepID=A0A8X7BRT6_9ARAC|nr:hypothetical protein TNIN_315791 [Trichonephila inaurata madagascariensis]
MAKSRLLAAVSNGGFLKDGYVLDPPSPLPDPPLYRTFSTLPTERSKTHLQEMPFLVHRVNLLFPTKSFLFIEGPLKGNKNPIKEELG